jgi:hypothetical protein
VAPHPSAAEALAAAGWDQARANPGAVGDLDRLDTLVRPAVEQARAQMRVIFEAAEADVAGRVEAWAKRLRMWEDDADVLAQHTSLKQRRLTVRHEQELVDAMKPAQQLVRPLLVVVPEGWAAR